MSINFVQRGALEAALAQPCHKKVMRGTSKRQSALDQVETAKRPSSLVAAGQLSKACIYRCGCGPIHRDGYLVELAMSGTGFACAFPSAQISVLKRLRRIDLSGSSLVGKCAPGYFTQHGRMSALFRTCMHNLHYGWRPLESCAHAASHVHTASSRLAVSLTANAQETL